jgi:hypothetical protein
MGQETRQIRLARAWIGVPIEAALLVLLSTGPVKAFFEGGGRGRGV